MTQNRLKGARGSPLYLEGLGRKGGATPWAFRDPFHVRMHVPLLNHSRLGWCLPMVQEPFWALCELDGPGRRSQSCYVSNSQKEGKTKVFFQRERKPQSEEDKPSYLRGRDSKMGFCRVILKLHAYRKCPRQVSAFTFIIMTLKNYEMECSLV